MTDQKLTPYEVIGEEMLSHLVDSFYGKVQKHPMLSPIFPDDLTETARKQKQFLTQYLGGPQLYTEEHGHPMLRARHLPFPITPARANAWIQCMKEAMNDVGLTGDIKDFLLHRLQLTAHHMVNTNGEDNEQKEVYSNE
ncbi:globin domain-containing protein [Metabacillus niabensis]|uniref:Hemoglobin n=1 Tax=Metabacillus niabensis TaxID=324854 RepID=A0ABT9YW40_9BACI|nr:thiol management oxidoreductase [Metabacillus niabensis]MDQ0224147.1 hemoglobin [Metabacillus niabensis]